MARAAGVVNRDGVENDEVFRAVMSASPEEIQQLASAVRAVIYDVYPAAVEVVWRKQRSVGWGIGPKKFTEQFAYLMPFKGHVTVGFYHGADLPDPAGLLPVSRGKQVSGTLAMRSLKLTHPDDVEQPALRTLIEEAARHQATLAPGARDSSD
ncbi:MAG: DUF1801 domain-containing protein [Actinomycetota bacterium]|nr:DUF1801 domain-containing protein [Actinomycetota bacterium]